MIHEFAFAVLVLPLASPYQAGTNSSGIETCQSGQEGTQKSKRELRQELKEKMAGIDKKDAKALFSLALWAQRKGLKLAVPRILRKVIAIDPDHAEARDLLGYARFEKKWVRKRDLERIRKRAKEAEYKKLGMIKINGEWVKKEDAAYARLGFTYVDKKWVRKSDQEMLAKGKVRHARTGLWIDKKNADKAAQGLFPHLDRWVPLDKADRMHKNWENPWVLQRDDFVLKTDYAFDKAEQILNEAETALSYFKQLFYNSSLPLPKRIHLFAFSSLEDYQAFGAKYDESGYSNYGAFYTPRPEEQPVAVLYGAAAGWGPYYLRYAVGLGASILLIGSQDLPFTHWIHSGMGSYIEHYSNTKDSRHFGRQYDEKGGVHTLKSFWRSFRISGDQDDRTRNWNVYQAGILIAYVKNVLNKKVRAAWDDLKLASTSGDRKKIRKAVKTLEKRLEASQKDIKDYLKSILQS